MKSAFARLVPGAFFLITTTWVTSQVINPLLFRNPALISIIDHSVAVPSPSIINVENVHGRISELSVSLYGFSHTFPSDVGVLLVGPAGQKVVLMNNVGGGEPGCSQVIVAFDQNASGSIPAHGPVTSGIYLPLDNNAGDRLFRGSAPAGPYANTLNAFKDTNPNGTWSLYVEDFTSGDSGAISNGWELAITTGPVINGLSTLAGSADAPLSQNFTVRDDSPPPQGYQFTAISDNQSVVTNGGIQISANGTNGTVTINPVPCSFGAANVTIYLTDQFTNQVNASFEVVLGP